MALQGTAVGASAALGCGTMGIAVYANIAEYLTKRTEQRQNHEGTPDCAAQIIATVGGISKQVLGAPALVRSAFTDPMEELRKAGQHNEKFATAEISVAGSPLSSGYAAFNGEVLRAGPSFDRALPLVALGGAEVNLDGKTLTVLPKQIPKLLLQLPNENEAEKWYEWLQKATEKDDPIQRLHDVLTEAHDLEKHLSDIHDQRRRQSPTHQEGHSAPSFPSSPVAAPPVQSSASTELLEEMKQQLLLKESLESALRQKLEYMDLQVRQKEQENKYLKAEMDVMREATVTPAVDQELVQQVRHFEEALALERANAVAQAKALAEAHVQLKRLQERPNQEALIVRQQQEEMMQLRTELRRLEEERNQARMSLANQAIQLAKMNDQQMELQSALNEASSEIKHQKEQLEEAEARTRNLSAVTPRSESARSNAGPKLSHSELQVLRTHMQSAVRRALEGAGGEQGQEYHQKLQELDEKLVELSPTRFRVRSSGNGSEPVIRDVEQKLSQLSPRRFGVVGSSNAFGMEAQEGTAQEASGGMRMSPLRRPSNLAGLVEARQQGVLQGLSSAGEAATLSHRPSVPLSAVMNLSASHPGSYSHTLPIRSFESDMPRSTVRPVPWSTSSLQVPPGPSSRPVEVLPAAQMAANAMAATAGAGAPQWRPNYLNPKAFHTLQR